MTPTPDKAVAAGVLMFFATVAGALLEGTFTLATLGVALGAAIAGALAVYRVPYFRDRPRRLRRRRRHRRRL